MPPKRKASAGAELAVKAAKPGRRQQRQADPPESQAGPSVDQQQLPVNQPPSQQDVLAQILAAQQRAEARFDLLAKEVGTLKTQMAVRDQATASSVLNQQTAPSIVNDDGPTQQHNFNMQNCRGASNDVLFSNNNPARQQVPLQNGALNVGGEAAIAMAQEIVGGEKAWPVYGHVDEETRRKVRNFEPIDLRDLLRDVVDSGEDKNKDKKKLRPLTEAEWRRAYNIYSALLLTAHPEHINGVFSHGERVNDLMAYGDVEERFEKPSLHLSWPCTLAGRLTKLN